MSPTAKRKRPRAEGEAPKKRRRGVRGGRARKKKIEPGTQ